MFEHCTCSILCPLEPGVLVHWSRECLSIGAGSACPLEPGVLVHWSRECLSIGAGSACPLEPGVLSGSKKLKCIYNSCYSEGNG